MFSLFSIFMIIVMLSLKALQWDVGCNAFKLINMTIVYV